MIDYETDAVSREFIRKYSLCVREFLKLSPNEPFPVLWVLEQVPFIFSDCSFEILDNSSFEYDVKGRCIPNSRGGYTIQIPQYIYDGAYSRQIGAYQGFICHEISHVFMFKIGFTPLYERSFTQNKKIPAYKSIEWQAKALAGELMMPYQATENKSIEWITQTYNVSKGFAISRQNY